MPKLICKTVYSFEELSDSAKERARDWFRQFVFSDSNDWDHVYSDAQQIAEMMGIEINQRYVRTMGGKSVAQPRIYFSGFSSQGDGACYEADYHYKAGSVKAVKAYAPKDAALHRIVQGLSDIQRKHGYRITATTNHSGHYYHSGCMSVEVGGYGDEFNTEIETVVTQLLRDFADWIYNQLSAENDYQNSDEVVDETIIANEYHFSDNGSAA